VAAVDAALDARAAAPPPTPAEEDDFLAPLRARFRAGLGGRLRDIEAAAGDRAERDTLMRELHKLRGAAAGYGFDGLADAAADAEEAVRGGDGDAEVARLIQSLRTVVAGG
ncbi:MAG TPA: Hpt domain-containing protein, partial [Longimicrobium sp.]|nr:Hpt domain-containing protein [Longimicrobium sp.]